MAAAIEVEADTSLAYNDLAPAQVTITTRHEAVLRGSCPKLPKGIESARDASLMERKRRSCIAMSEHGSASEYLSSVADLLTHAEAKPGWVKAVVEGLTP